MVNVTCFPYLRPYPTDDKTLMDSESDRSTVYVPRFLSEPCQVHRQEYTRSGADDTQNPYLSPVQRSDYDAGFSGPPILRLHPG
ncbi:hypothetical protein T265_12274 [Opisthorchis viverrini]|uniref:Uncharacterized protein n=1 Tax=Opisthorchis viverrini TaxID=6198 RepID=A0A074ZT47_OPIVI|nr:hypothetical protein T265_12274 [Opisthorchis viverrini]KER18439.1 hypothetical protein T265_12274 [Opisthorchis viverrini]